VTSGNMKPSETVSGSAERQLFFQALEKRAGKERAAFLDVACANDPDLRRRLEALLQKFETLGTFLDEPAVSAPELAPLRGCCRGPRADVQREP